MKNLKTLSLLLIAMLFCNLAAISQEEEEEIEIEEVVEDDTMQESGTIKGTFDGFEGDSYSFNFTNEDGDSDTMFFTKINPEVLKMFNLKDKKFIGKTFEITYSSEIESEIDEDGDKQEYVIRTITNLKSIN